MGHTRNPHGPYQRRFRRQPRIVFAAALAIFLAPVLAVGQTSPTSAGSDVDAALRPALEQIGPALQQVRIDRWKLSRRWKDQFSSDAGSIQQDLTGQLPALMTAAQQSPATLAPQLAVMHNVDALYDVLVRVSTAANIAGGSKDAGILDDAVQRLESARGVAADQLLQAVTLREAEIARLHAAIQAAQNVQLNSHPKTIVVINRVTHRRRHHDRTAVHRKTAVKKPTPGQHEQPAAPSPH